MAFSIFRMIADSDQNVVALDWVYSNEDGSVTNQHVLEQPYGTTPLDEVTEGLAITWLEEQLQNTPAEFDAAIAERKAAVEYEKTLSAYTPQPEGPPTPEEQKVEPVTAAWKSYAMPN